MPLSDEVATFNPWSSLPPSLLRNARTRGHSGTGAWNTGLEALRAVSPPPEWVAVLDDDDEFLPGHLACSHFSGIQDSHPLHLLVGIIFRNAPSTLANAVDSVEQQIGSGLRVSILLVDDASTDDWQAVLGERLASPHLQLRQVAFRSAAKARNFVLTEAERAFPTLTMSAAGTRTTCLPTRMSSEDSRRFYGENVRMRCSPATGPDPLRLDTGVNLRGFIMAKNKTYSPEFKAGAMEVEASGSLERVA